MGMVDKYVTYCYTGMVHTKADEKLPPCGSGVIFAGG